MSEILIKNASVCDPAQGVNCEAMDICIRDGKIVDSVSEVQSLLMQRAG